MDQAFQDVTDEQLVRSPGLWGYRIQQVGDGFVLRLLVTTPPPGMETIEHRIFLDRQSAEDVSNTLQDMLRLPA